MLVRWNWTGGGELALVHIDFSAVFDRVYHGGLVFKLQEDGVGGIILKVFFFLIVQSY